MKEFNALDYVCPACPAGRGQWCYKDWPSEHFVQPVGFTHPQRTTYNLLANQPADGTPASDDQIRDAALRSGLI